MIDFYTSSSPNGVKAPTVLEEAELEYPLYALNLSEGSTRPDR